MTPLHLRILLHYYYSAEEWTGHENIQYHQRLVADELIRRTFNNIPPYYTITERGRAFIDHVLHLPLPEQRWVMPAPTEGKHT